LRFLSLSVFQQILGYGNLGGQLAQGASQLTLLRFSGGDETEADLLGMDLAARTGYDPRAAVKSWQKVPIRKSRVPSIENAKIGSADGAGGAVDLCERRRHLLEELDRAGGGQRRGLLGDLPDLGHSFPYSLHGGLGAPAEGMPPESRREGPLVRRGWGHR